MSKVISRNINIDRLKRSRIFYSIAFIVIFTAAIFFLLAFRSLILPTIIGTLSAYIILPLLSKLRRIGIPKGIALLILFSGFTFVVFILGKKISNFIPSDQEQLELRVQVQYKVNQKFLQLTGREDFDSEGNFIYSIFGNELNPVIENFNEFIALTPEERESMDGLIMNSDSGIVVSDRIIKYYESVSKLPYPQKEKEEKKVIEAESALSSISITNHDSKIAKLVNALSNWIILPFVFIFLLVDEGQIKKAIIGILPNKYFEMSLTVFDNVDTAIGNYLRGTLMQCSLVGISFIVGLTIIGFDFNAAVLVGIVAGISNAIPFLGPVLGLGIGVIYSMIVDGIHPLIPFITIDPMLGVVIVVLIVQGLDNTIFQPLVLGKAVNLHPLVVVLGVTGGSILFGVAGTLLAIPTIVVIKVVAQTVHTQLKLYYIIY